MKPALALLTLALLLTGCSASRGKVTARADEGHTLLAQSFNSAYITSNHTGEYDVVLIQDPQAKPAASSNRTWKSFLTGAPTPPPPPPPPPTAHPPTQAAPPHPFSQTPRGPPPSSP